MQIDKLLTNETDKQGDYPSELLDCSLLPLNGNTIIYQKELLTLKLFLIKGSQNISNTEISDLLYRVCSFKSYEPLVVQTDNEILNDTELDLKRIKKLRLMSQATVVKSIWVFIVDELQRQATEIVSSVFNEKGHNFKEFISIYEQFMEYFEHIHIVIDFFHTNFPTVLKESIYFDIESSTYFKELLLDPLFSEFGKELKMGLHTWFESSWSTDTMRYSKTELEFIRYLLRRNPTLYDEPFKQCLNSCIEQIANIVYEEIESNQDTATVKLQNIVLGIQKIVCITWPLNKELVSPFVELFIENTLLKDHTAGNIINIFFKNNNQNISDVNVLYRTIHGTFLERNLGSKFKDEIRYAFNKSLRDGPYHFKNSSPIEYFILAIRYICFISNVDMQENITNVSFDEFNKVIREEIYKFFGGNIKIVEIYQKLISSRMKGFQIDHPILTHEDLDTILCKIPYYLQFDKSFLSNHSNYLFRRIIMNGPSMLEDIAHNSFEYKLLTTYDEIYQNDDEASGFLSFSLDMRGACILSNSYLSEAEKQDTLYLVPLIFAKKSVPTIFQNSNIDQDIRLPKAFQEQWDHFSLFYNNQDKNEHKKLHQMYSLHHCEVETCYKLPNGHHLVLQLTLYQTLVLDLYNDNDSITINDISKQLKIDPGTIELILQSFININLIRKTERKDYELNNDFRPDLKKVRDNKMRVQLAKTTLDTKSVQSYKNKLAKHNEGTFSLWKLELLKAAITRTVKTHPTDLQFNELLEIVKTQNRGFSIGEFKDALNRTVIDGAIRQKDKYYYY